MISSSHMKPARNVYKFYLNLLSSLLWALQSRYFTWTAFSLTPSLSGDIQHEAPLVCRVKVLPPSLTSWVWALEPTSQEERPDSYSWLLSHPHRGMHSHPHKNLYSKQSLSLTVYLTCLTINASLIFCHSTTSVTVSKNIPFLSGSQVRIVPFAASLAPSRHKMTPIPQMWKALLQM